MQDNHRLLAMVCAVLADTAHEKLFDAGLVVLGHHHSWCLEILSPDANDFTNGVLIRIEVGDLDLVWDSARLCFCDKSVLYESFCLADLQQGMHGHAVKLQVSLNHDAPCTVRSKHMKTHIAAVLHRSSARYHPATCCMLVSVSYSVVQHSAKERCCCKGADRQHTSACCILHVYR